MEKKEAKSKSTKSANTKATKSKNTKSASTNVTKKASVSKASKKDNVKIQAELEDSKLEKYLPAGTVVKLKGGIKRVMITGFGVSGHNNPKEIWDYCGCIYPEGIISSDEMLLFDHEQITEVFCMGLIDEEQQEFNKKLVELMNSKKQ